MADQAENLRRKLNMKQKRKSAKTLCFISGKGGVGKSNVALNFAIELRQKRKRILLIDFDIGMGNIDVLLGVSSRKTIADLFNEELPIQEVINVGPDGLEYISGGSGLKTIFNLNESKREAFFTQYNDLTLEYDYIIFDMGAGVSESSMHFILAADECIVIVTPEPTSITDGYGMIKHVVNNQPNMPIYVVMNRSQTDISGRKAIRRFTHVIWEFLKVDTQVLGILPYDKLVPNAVMKQTPFVLLNSRAPISKGIKNMVANYLSNTSYDESQQTTSSFIHKLKALLKER